MAKKKVKSTVFGKKKPKTKRPLNEYFKKMLDAKKKGLSEFSYTTKEGKTKTYVRKETKSPKSGASLIVYKEKK